jgi:hypothetical protein
MATAPEKSKIDYRFNGHEFEVVERYEDQGSEIIQCSECLIREVLDDDDDPEEYLDLMTEECHIEWLRQPDGGFRGVALRNQSGFPGRQLIAVDSDGEITDKTGKSPTKFASTTKTHRFSAGCLTSRTGRRGNDDSR